MWTFCKLSWFFQIKAWPMPIQSQSTTRSIMDAQMERKARKDWPLTLVQERMMITPYSMRLVVGVNISKNEWYKWPSVWTIIIVGCVTRDMVGVCLIVVFSLLQTLIDIYRESGNIIIVTSWPLGVVTLGVSRGCTLRCEPYLAIPVCTRANIPPPYSVIRRAPCERSYTPY